MEIYRCTKLVASDTTNLETAVSHFFSLRDVQFYREMHQFNLCLKSGFVICYNYKSKDMLDRNRVDIRNLSGKKVNCEVIVTPDGSFLEGEALVKKLK